MNWIAQQEYLVRHLSPEVVRFVCVALVQLERENIFDAPGVIGGVIQQMRLAESPAVRAAAEEAESLLKRAFLNGRPRVSL